MNRIKNKVYEISIRVHIKILNSFIPRGVSLCIQSITETPLHEETYIKLQNDILRQSFKLLVCLITVENFS